MSIDKSDIYKVFKIGFFIVDDLEDKSKRRADYSDIDENGNFRLECVLLFVGYYKYMRELFIKLLNFLNDLMRFR